MVLVRMLFPELSCTASSSPCRYCKDAHPGTNNARVEEFGEHGGTSVTRHSFVLSFPRQLCFLMAPFCYVQLNRATLTWTLQLHQRYVEVSAAIAYVLVASAVSVNGVGCLLQR